MTKKIPPTLGARFGRLTPTREIMDRRTKKHRFFECACDCGSLRVVSQAHLRSGHTISCGCFRTETTIKVKTKHGETVGHQHGAAWPPEYRAWMNAKGRCFNPKNKAFHNYGARGITMCKEWVESYESFLSHVGRKPSNGLSLDRINNDGNYEPGNVRWTTWTQQRLNSRPRPWEKNSRKKLASSV